MSAGFGDDTNSEGLESPYSLTVTSVAHSQESATQMDANDKEEGVDISIRLGILLSVGEQITINPKFTTIPENSLIDPEGHSLTALNEFGQVLRSALDLWAMHNFRLRVEVANSATTGGFWAELQKLDIHETSSWNEKFPTFHAEATFNYSSKGCPDNLEDSYLGVNAVRPMEIDPTPAELLAAASDQAVTDSLLSQEERDIEQALQASMEDQIRSMSPESKRKLVDNNSDEDPEWDETADPKGKAKRRNTG